MAEQHGRVPALNLLGRRTVYDAVPYFWTIRFRKRFDYLNHADDWNDLVTAGDRIKPEFVALYAPNDRVAFERWRHDKIIASAIGPLSERRDWSVATLHQTLNV